MSKVFAEVSEDGRKIEIFFNFRKHPELANSMHLLRARYVSPEDGGPKWTLPLQLENARFFADEIGREHIELGDAITEWSLREVEAEKALVAVRAGGKLVRLPKVLPKLYKKSRRYQRDGIRFGAFVESLLVGDHAGIGKTLEAIGIVFESGNDLGAHLVICPVTSAESVWLEELRDLQPHAVYVATGEGMSKAERIEVLAGAAVAYEYGIPFWLVINPDMIRLVKDPENEEKLIPQFPFLFEVEWANIIADEIQKRGLRDTSTPTYKGFEKLKTREGCKKMPMSGTPMGGKTINLYGILHWMYPKRWSSKWEWAAQWMEVEHNGYGYEIGEIREGREEAFWRHLDPVMLRRTKEEVLPELPPKDRVPVWCRMTAGQSKQYRKFEKDALIRIEEEQLSATSILAEYTRLKQFADAKQRIEDGRLIATEDSCKLLSLVEKLDELGIMDGEGDAQAVVGSQFEPMAKMVYEYLTRKGVPSLLLTGKQRKKGQRAKMIRNFQSGEARVMVMTTDAGGVSITLDRADTVHILDEKWNPDDQEQLEDRVHRVSRIHQVTCYYYRTKDSIEEYIKSVTDKKGAVNAMVLDDIRRTLQKKRSR